MIDSKTATHLDGAPGASHLGVLGRLNSAWAIQPPCVLDLLGQARPQSCAAMESII
jgi:hypothetical protein